MTATDELRRLLDERGAEWIGTSFSKPAKGHPTNTSLGEEHHEATFIEYDDGNVLRLFDLTPAQAVEATLGSDLEAENEMLRKELAVTNPLFETLNAANDRLIYENMKLRELVKDMWQFTGAACKRYPRLFDQSAQGGQMVMPNMLDSFERRMRELGIEVDA